MIHKFAGICLDCVISNPVVKLGLTPWDLDDLSARNLTEQASLAESCGYSSFWLPEAHFSEPALPDPLMLLAAVAAGTNSIQLATTSYLLPLRNPLLAAEQVAVLDQLSEGRVLLGVGRGHSAETLQAFEILPNKKRSLFEHNLKIMLQAWAGAPVPSHPDDSAKATTPIKLAPLPLQHPHPPIWVAAFGPKALEQAGRLGLPYFASPLETLADLKKNFDRHDQALENAGHPVNTVRPIMRTVYVSDDETETAALRTRLATNVQPGLRHIAGEIADWAVLGPPTYVKDKLQEYQETLNLTHLVVSRLRIAGVSNAKLRASVERIVELV